MNKASSVFIVLATLFGLSQAAIAAEQSPLYVGAGLARLSNGGTPASVQEQMFMAPGPYQYSRTEKSRGLGGDIFVGYKLSKTFALEAGYIGGDNNLGSSMTGNIHWLSVSQSGTTDAYEPFSVTQTKKVSAWYISAIGEKSLTGRISMIGRVGIMQSRTEWEQRLAYGCTPGFACVPEPYQGWSSTSTRTAALFGVGLAMKVADNMEVRVEVMDSSALPSALPMANLVYQF